MQQRNISSKHALQNGLWAKRRLRFPVLQLFFSLHRSRTFQSRNYSRGVAHTGLHGAAALHRHSRGNRALLPHRFPLCMLHSIMLPAEAHRAQYQVLWNHRKHGMLRRLVLLIGTTWRGYREETTCKELRNLTPNTGVKF